MAWAAALVAFGRRPALPARTLSPAAGVGEDPGRFIPGARGPFRPASFGRWRIFGQSRRGGARVRLPHRGGGGPEAEFLVTDTATSLVGMFA